MNKQGKLVGFACKENEEGLLHADLEAPIIFVETKVNHFNTP